MLLCWSAFALLYCSVTGDVMVIIAIQLTGGNFLKLESKYFSTQDAMVPCHVVHAKNRLRSSLSF